MSILFGILFMLGGLMLAVFLGIVLYREPKREARPYGSSLRTAKKPEAA